MSWVHPRGPWHLPNIMSLHSAGGEIGDNSSLPSNALSLCHFSSYLHEIKRKERICRKHSKNAYDKTQMKEGVPGWAW